MTIGFAFLHPLPHGGTNRCYMKTTSICPPPHSKAAPLLSDLIFKRIFIRIFTPHIASGSHECYAQSGM